MRLLILGVLVLLLAVPAARAGRELTPVQAAQVRAIAYRVRAERQARADRRRATADKKQRTRDAKMAAALEMAVDYKAEKARRQAAREAARKRETAKRNAARLRFVEELLRTRAGSR